jgi:hypothetical protein
MIQFGPFGQEAEPTPPLPSLTKSRKSEDSGLTLFTEVRYVEFYNLNPAKSSSRPIWAVSQCQVLALDIAFYQSSENPVDFFAIMFILFGTAACLTGTGLLVIGRRD